MKVESVNVGAPEEIAVGTRIVSTGIRKLPVPRARIHLLGVEGDVVTDSVHHGGPDQAVYVYSREDYDFWEPELSRLLAPGSFGENLTLSSFGPAPVRVGDRYRTGDALLEVAAPRIPCSVFAVHTGEKRWVRRFRDAGRPGLYCRVLEEGEVAVGDRVERVHAPAESPEVLELFRLHYDADAPEEALRRLLRAPIAVRAREDLERRLGRVAGGATPG